jgi:RNA polymerase sigma factor (sigma-70 family)
VKVLEKLYDAEQAGLVRLAVLLTGSRADAEEVVQDAFVAISGRVDELDQPGAYLRTSVVNGCHSLLRRRQTAESKRTAVEMHYGERTGLSDVPIPPHLGELAGALDALTERQRAVVVLRYLLDIDDGEIAETLGIAQGTVRTVARRALAVLRDELSAGHEGNQP